jgi:hypothetical protein
LSSFVILIGLPSICYKFFRDYFQKTIYKHVFCYLTKSLRYLSIFKYKRNNYKSYFIIY